MKTFRMKDSRPVGTPMVISHKLSKSDDSSEVNQTLYRPVIGKLSYVVLIKLDITLVIDIIARFSINHRENHMMAIKGILIYLKGTKDYGLWYKRNDTFEINVYTCDDWDGNIDKRKSKSGGDLFLGRRLISLTSKK